MRSDLLQTLEAEYAQRRQANAREEDHRREEAIRACPGLDGLLQRRQEMIYRSMRGILAGQVTAEDIPARMDEANEAIRRLLKEHGFPGDYLEPVYTCPVCHDTGYTGEPVRRMCRCMEARSQELLTGALGLNADGDQSFEAWDDNVYPDQLLPGAPFTQREQMRMARRSCEALADRWPGGPVRLLLITGESGLGKTYLLHCMARRLLERGPKALMVSSYRALEAARKAYFGQGEEDLAALMACDVLLVDDLGSEPLLQNITVEQLYNLINERSLAGHVTALCSNLSLPEIRARYTERVASRLSDRSRAQVIALRGEDIRRL